MPSPQPRPRELASAATHRRRLLRMRAQPENRFGKSIWVLGWNDDAGSHGLDEARGLSSCSKQNRPADRHEIGELGRDELLEGRVRRQRHEKSIAGTKNRGDLLEWHLRV